MLPVTIVSASRPPELQPCILLQAQSLPCSGKLWINPLLRTCLSSIVLPNLRVCSSVSPPILTSGHHPPGLFYLLSTSKKCVSVSSWAYKVQSWHIYLWCTLYIWPAFTYPKSKLMTSFMNFNIGIYMIDCNIKSRQSHCDATHGFLRRNICPYCYPL